MPTDKTAGLRSGGLLCRLSSILALVVFPLAAYAADGSQAARQWLTKMGEASRVLSYEGTFVYRQGARLETMRIIHRMDADGERERLVSMNGVAREVLRDETGVTCILPDNHSVVVDKSRRNGLLPGAFHDYPQDLDTYYTFAFAGDDRVAGRSARIIEIKPRDEYRYGYRLWLDERTKLRLKSELIDEGGKVLEQILFTTMNLPEAIPDEMLEPAVSGEGFSWFTSDGSRSPVETVGVDWDVAWLPEGFTLTSQEADPLPKGHAPVQHLLFTDGLASVSLYIEGLAADKERFEGFSQMGAMNAYGVVVDDYQVTVVGEVPKVTVDRVGAAISRK